MADTAKAASEPTARRAGRPRRLSINQIVDTALELGLDGLTMGAVARQLGVSITVLYGYVANRNELIRIASARVAAAHDFPADADQSWALYAAGHACALYSLFTGPGQLVARYLAGGLAPELEIDQTEQWLAALMRRGFSASEALQLQRQMAEIVIGGAVIVLHMRALEASGQPYPLSAMRAVDQRDEAEIPLLAAHGPLFATREPIWQETLLRLFEATARDRGEALDVAAVRRGLRSLAEA